MFEQNQCFSLFVFYQESNLFDDILMFFFPIIKCEALLRLAFSARAYVRTYVLASTLL